MIIIMKQGTTHEHVEELSQHIERWNVKANPIYGEDTIVIGLVGDTGAVDKDALMLDPQVENIIKVQEPFKLANRKFHPDDTIVDVGGHKMGGGYFAVMSGPCSVESKEQITYVAQRVQASYHYDNNSFSSEADRDDYIRRQLQNEISDEYADRHDGAYPDEKYLNEETERRLAERTGMATPESAQA